LTGLGADFRKITATFHRFHHPYTRIETFGEREIDETSGGSFPWPAAFRYQSGARATSPAAHARLIAVRVYLGSDHAGFELKAALIEWLKQAGHEPVDCGPSSLDPADDYPPYVMHAASKAVNDPGSLGIVIGGSGNGEAIAANKIKGVRAAIAWSDETAQLARLHNNANVLSLGARMYSIEDAVGFARVFVETAFSGEPRHTRRLEEIATYEDSGQLPPDP
jgi:ribose 5-phosphate isomerase B